MRSASPYPTCMRFLLSISACLLAIPGHAQSAAPFANPYQPIPNFKPYNVVTDSPTANDCTNSPQQFHQKPVIYVTPADPKVLSQALHNLQVQPGQLVCVATGIYAPFTISTGGTSYTNMTSFEVIPGNTATIDLEQGGASTAWAGISISNGTFHPTKPDYSEGYTTFAPLSYVVVSGFYLHGPDDAISGGAYGGGPAANAGAASGFFNAPGISIIGNNNSVQGFVPGSEVDHIYVIGNHIEGAPGGGVVAIFGDYIVVNSNIIKDSAWFTSYGSSAISLLDSYGTHPSDDTSPNQGPGYNYKNYIINNTLENNAEYVPWVGAPNGPQVTDGEGIIIDTNLNSDYTGNTFGGSTTTNGTFVPAYGGYTLVENNSIYSGGSAAIETVSSRNVDIMYNSTFNNDLNVLEGEGGKGEVFLYDSLNVQVGDNILYSSVYDTPVDQVVNSWFISGTPLNAKIGSATVKALAVPSVFQNLFYNPQGKDNSWTAGYAPTNGGYGVMNHGGDPGFINGEVQVQTSPDGVVSETATDHSVVNLNIPATSSNLIQNGWNWLMLPTDINQVSRGTGTYNTYSVGAYFIPF